MPLLSVIAGCFNEAGNVEEIHARITAALRAVRANPAWILKRKHGQLEL